MAAPANSLVEAIKRKYDPGDSDKVSVFKHMKEVAVSQKPGDCNVFFFVVVVVVVVVG